MSLEAVGERVLCKLILTDPKTESGLFLPTQTPTSEAEVISIGESFNHNVKVGDRVLYEKHGGIPLNHEGNKYVMFTIDELLGVVEP